jgi:hypothetical protein
MLGRRVTCALICLLGSALLACAESRAGADEEPTPAEGGAAGAGTGGNGQAGTGTGGSGQAGAGTGGSGQAGAGTECVNGCSWCGFADEDGDGWGNENLVCADTYPGIVSGLGGDCDDTNPELQQALWVDQDHDGAGIQGKFGCFEAGELPPGYAHNAFDCVDDDPNFGPHVVDFAGDGLDRDCDGRDGGFDCGLTFEPIDLTGEPHCEGFDLMPVDSASCYDCSLRRLARIANVGTEAVEGDIYVTTDDGGQVKIVEGLPAGTVSEPFEIPFFEQTFHVSTGEGSDCNPDNDAYTLPEPAGMRAFCTPK